MTDHSPNPTRLDDWWSAFFDDAYAAYGLANEPPDVTRHVVDFLMQMLELRDGQTVLDQCCGIGRLSIPLAQRGVKVIGIEQAESYVTVARRRSVEMDLPCEFHQGDALTFVAPRPCDAAFNWFTSFGYHEDDSMNAKMLARAFASLKPGGRFVLDYLHLPRVFAEFKQVHVDRPAAADLQGLIVIQETEPDFLTGMMNSRWTFLYPDGRRIERHIRTRMLLPSDFVRMFRTAGFEDVKLFGWVTGEPHTRLSRRCIVMGCKPERPPASRTPGH